MRTLGNLGTYPKDWISPIWKNCPTLFCSEVEQIMYHVAKKSTCEPLATSGSCRSKGGYQPPLTNTNKLTYITHYFQSEIYSSTTNFLDVLSAILYLLNIYNIQYTIYYIYYIYSIYILYILYIYLPYIYICLGDNFQWNNHNLNKWMQNNLTNPFSWGCKSCKISQNFQQLLLLFLCLYLKEIRQNQKVDSHWWLTSQNNTTLLVPRVLKF